MFKMMSWLQASFTTYQQISKYALKHFVKNIQNYLLNVSFSFCCVQIVDILIVLKRAPQIKITQI